MMDLHHTPSLPGTAFALPVLPGIALEVVSGANLGDPLSFAADLIHDDVYSLTRGARTRLLSLHPDGPARFRVALDSAAGQPGALIHLASHLPFMSGVAGGIDWERFVEGVVKFTPDAALTFEYNVGRENDYIADREKFLAMAANVTK